MRVVIMGSGRGSNAAAILEAERMGALGRAQVVAVISDKPDAPILALAGRYGKPALFWETGPYKTRFSDEGNESYITRLRELKPDLIVLAGFMRILKPELIEAFPQQIINLHPSLLPSFPGLDGIGQAWRRGVKVTGCTVHYVTPEVDAGPIIDQSVVRVEPLDTLESLSQKVHAAEHRLLPAVIARLSERAPPGQPFS